MAEIQQSPQYAKFIASINWIVERVDGTYIFIKKFAFIGGLAKIQRSDFLPDPTRTTQILQKLKVKTIAIEPTERVSGQVLTAWCQQMKKNFKINSSQFLATKTNLIDLTKDEETIFASFTEAKRRGTRRARKADLTIYESSDIEAMIRIKNKSAGLFGFITTFGIEQLWEKMKSKHATLVLASHKGTNVGGIMLLFHQGTAYYWLAGATHTGKKFFAPTLLAWEAIKIAKNRKAALFDFVGVWDERLPNRNKERKGFTKFKEGFGGTSKYHPLTKDH